MCLNRSTDDPIYVIISFVCFFVDHDVNYEKEKLKVSKTTNMAIIVMSVSYLTIPLLIWSAELIPLIWHYDTVDYKYFIVYESLPLCFYFLGFNLCDYLIKCSWIAQEVKRRWEKKKTTLYLVFVWRKQK